MHPMRWFGRFALSVVFAAGVAAAAACTSGGTNCFPADYRACTCDDGKSGLQACAGSGDHYGTCDCTGKIPVPEAVDAGPDSGPILEGFGMACSKDDDCPSKACFAGGMRSFCSYKCASAADCPNPPTAGVCNMRGFCKAP